MASVGAAVLKVGAAVTELLSSDASVSSYLGNKIFPTATQEDTPRPFLIYQRTGLNPAYTKDNRAYDSVYLAVTIISDTYSGSVMGASAVLNALERKRGVYAGLNIDDIMLADANEGADETNYIQDLQFEIFIDI